MKDFKDKYNNEIYGILHGFDRMIIKGHIFPFYYGNNFYYFLNEEGRYSDDTLPLIPTIPCQSVFDFNG